MGTKEEEKGFGLSQRDWGIAAMCKSVASDVILTWNK
jgi:hypothetical protein